MEKLEKIAFINLLILKVKPKDKSETQEQRRQEKYWRYPMSLVTIVIACISPYTRVPISRSMKII